MRILIVTTHLPLVWGGAEFHAEGLARALRAVGHEVDIIRIPYNSRTPEQVVTTIQFCLHLNLSHCSGNKIDRLIGLKFPAYLVPHSEKLLWILHQDRKLYDLWERFSTGLKADSEWFQVRETVHRLDTECMSRAQRVYANSHNVANRLRRYNGIESTPLYHPPPSAEKFYCESQEDYFLLPSRITDHKRQDLVLEALSVTQRPVRVVFLGVGDNLAYEERLKQRCKELKIEERCKWNGWVTEEEKIGLYARCSGVIYPPYDEDLGYVTLEAMLASKPVITCTDSGGPLEFVENEATGLICAPTPDDLAAAMDRLWEDKALAKSLGAAGRTRYHDLSLSWSSAVETLLQ